MTSSKTIVVDVQKAKEEERQGFQGILLEQETQGKETQMLALSL